MKIAFYCPNKPLSHPLPSGDLTIARGIYQALTRLGHQCREMSELRSRWLWKTARGWQEAASAFVSAYRLAMQFRPHIWLTYHTYYKSPDLLGPWICRLQDIPYVLFQPMYGTRKRKDPNTRVGFYLNRMAIKAAHHAFTNNLDDLEALHRILPRARLTYIPPGIFPEEFRRDEHAGRAIRERYQVLGSRPLLLAAAMLREDVKFESLTYLFRSLRFLYLERIDFTLLIVGDGPMKNELRRLADELLPSRVAFAGRVPREKMPAYYSAADLFVFPGLGESLGMVYLEAQACGCPVVALKTAGTPQVVLADQTGLLVSADDGSTMARAVGQLLEDRPLRKRFAENGVAYIQAERNLHRNYLELSRRLQRYVDALGKKS